MIGVYSREARCRYRSNQLGEVICQLRFPKIPALAGEVPAAFREAIRVHFPIYSARREILPGLPGTIPAGSSALNHAFATEDHQWKVNLTSRFISLSALHYDRWEEFAARLDAPLAEFIMLCRPACFERVGLRYVNFISRRELDLGGIPFRELLQDRYLGVMAEENLSETDFIRSSVDADFATRRGCRAKIHAGPGLVHRGGTLDPELKLIFDQDLYRSGQIPLHQSAQTLQMLHTQAWELFRGAITDRLHQAMEPEEI